MASNSSNFIPFNAVRNFWNQCLNTKNHINALTVFTAVHLFLLPFLFYILYLGYQQWKEKHLLPAAHTNPSDILTFNSVFLQLCSTLGIFIFFWGSIHATIDAVLGGFTLVLVTYIGVDVTDLVVCLLHYMAVVHPVHYLQLKQSSKAQACSGSIGWISAFVSCIFVVSEMVYTENNLFFVCWMSLNLSIITFCCTSVLCALKRPRPGEAGGNQGRHSQLKQRAFHTIATIMAALTIKFFGNLIVALLFNLTLSITTKCNAYMVCMFLVLPGNLVLPLLFLLRAGKLPCLKSRSKS